MNRLSARIERPDALFHRARHVVDDAERDGRVLVRKMGDLLLNLVVKNLEMVFAQAGHEPVVRVGHGDDDVYNRRAQLHAVGGLVSFEGFDVGGFCYRLFIGGRGRRGRLAAFRFYRLRALSLLAGLVLSWDVARIGETVTAVSRARKAKANLFFMSITPGDRVAFKKATTLRRLRID